MNEGSPPHQPHRHEQQQPTEDQQSTSSGTPAARGGALLPDHLRLVVTPELAACLTAGRSGRSSRSSSSRSSSRSSLSTRCRGSIASSSSSRASNLSSSGSSGSLSQLADCHDQLHWQQADPIDGEAMPAGWPAVFERARRQAQQSRWCKPVAPLQLELAAVAAAGCLLNQAEREAFSTQPAEAALVTADTATAGAGARRPAVAWSIPADSESEDTDECWWGSGSTSERSGGSKGAAALALTSGSSQQQFQAGEQQPVEVCDAAAAWRCIAECSIVVGCHPDQATGETAADSVDGWQRWWPCCNSCLKPACRNAST